MIITVDFSTMSSDELAMVYGEHEGKIPAGVTVANISMRFSSCGSTGLRKYATKIDFYPEKQNAAHNE
jgi:hypothetical protein